jgi:PAT family acetyl-CoA transporter-like MFS transporter 1
LFVVLLSYRLPTALSDNVKFLKAVEYGLSKSTTALLSPTLILPLGIVVPLVAAKVWHGHPFRQFMTAYKLRVTLVPLLDVFMLWAVRQGHGTTWSSLGLFWLAVVASTGMQAIVNSLQFNAQMTFFASRVDPAIGGSYMTLLNTAANLGGTWPASVVMLLVGRLTTAPDCRIDVDTGLEVCTGGRDGYFPLQALFSVLGCAWILFMGRRVQTIAQLPDDAWRTHLLDEDEVSFTREEVAMEAGESTMWNNRKDEKRE